jgi:hypothetical protein
VEYIQSAIDAMNELYGSTIGFITKGLGVNIDRLKDLYLDE